MTKRVVKNQGISPRSLCPRNAHERSQIEDTTADMHAAHGRLRVEPVATPYPLRKLLAGITQT